MPMKIVQAECTSCGACEAECPTDSIAEKKGIYKVNAETCNLCEGEAKGPHCVAACPDGDNCIVLA